MTDDDILQRIATLEQQEHELQARAQEDDGLDADGEMALEVLRVALNQHWDLLRQRRARHYAGLDADAPRSAIATPSRPTNNDENRAPVGAQGPRASPWRLWSAVEVRKEIAAPPERVFAVIADPNTYPSWLVGAKRMRRVDRAFPRPGTEFHHTVGAGPISLDDSSEVVDVAPGRLELEVRVGPFHADVVMAVRPEAGGTEVCMTERPTGAPALVTPLVRGVLWTRNTRSLDNLARFVGQHRGP